MSGAGTANTPKYRFCWVCSRQLHGNFHRVAIVDGHDVIVHADCAAKEGLQIKPAAHLSGRISELGWRILVVYARPSDPRICAEWYPLTGRIVRQYIACGWLRKNGRLTQEITDAGREALARYEAGR